MTRLHLSLFAALVLTGCGPNGDDASPAPTEGSPATTTVPADFNPTATPVPQTLTGEYRIAAINGEELDAPVGIAVSISATEISLAPCAGFAWTYTLASGALQTKRIPVSADTPTCRIPEQTARAGVALADATRVRRTAANGVELRGGGRSVLLFSQ